jgi:signal transduction histidine kinase
MADGDRLSTVFSNLISNATKYSPASTPCLITVQLAERGFRNLRLDDASPGWVVVGVSDQGIGIAPEEMSQLFTKFGRLRRSLTTSVRGTGLGLWICKQYIDAMGGDIWVDSEFGKGSNFQFCLPLAQSPQSR